MVRAAFLDVVFGRAQNLRRGQLLQRRFPVQARAQARRAGDHRVEQAVHERVRRREALVQVNGADDRLQGVGQDRGLVPAAGALLALAQADITAELQPAGDAREGAHVDDGRAQLGQLALGQIRVRAKQGVGHDQPEHGVAQELQPLVRRQAAVLVGVRAMHERTLQQFLAHRHLQRAEQRGRRLCSLPLRP